MITAKERERLEREAFEAWFAEESARYAYPRTGLQKELMWDGWSGRGNLAEPLQSTEPELAALLTQLAL